MARPEEGVPMLGGREDDDFAVPLSRTDLACAKVVGLLAKMDAGECSAPDCEGPLWQFKEALRNLDLGEPCAYKNNNKDARPLATNTAVSVFGDMQR